MNPDTVLRYCEQIDTLTQLIRDEVLVPAPPIADCVVVPAEGDLQAALSMGGGYELEAGATFAAPKGYRLEVPDTLLRGQGENALVAAAAPAITIPVTMHGVIVETLAVASTEWDVAVQVGRNDVQQTTREQAPTGIRFRALRSLGHRGKRVFEINAGDVEFADCQVLDCYDPEGLDSQAIWIGNAPGPVTIHGGYFEAASETVMVGGDRMKIPDCRPTGITIRGAVVTKPLAWKEAGTPKVKNLIELKDGHHVLIDQCELFHCWTSAQTGYAFMFTPANGGSLQDVVVKECLVHDVGGIVNVTGTDASGVNPQRSQVEFRGGEYRTNRAQFPGRGCFALVTRGPEWVIVDGVKAVIDGNAFFDLADDKKPIDLVRLVNSRWNYGSYGIRIGGYNHGDNQLGLVGTLVIEDNVISGAHAQFRARYPQNTYIDNMTRDREQHVDRAPWQE